MRQRRHPVAAGPLLCLLLLGAAGCDDGPTRLSEVHVEGLVIDEATGLPVFEATVSIHFPESPWGGGGPSSEFTDSTGYFVIRSDYGGNGFFCGPPSMYLMVFVQGSTNGIQPGPQIECLERLQYVEIEIAVERELPPRRR